MSNRRAVWLLVAMGAAGAIARLAGNPGEAPGAIAYRPAAGPRSPLDSVAARAGRLARPLRKGETIDIDRSSAEDLARLPRIGSGIAARIVGDREENGPFGSLEGLHRVSGVGPSLLAAIKPYAVFSGAVAGPADTPPLRDLPRSPLLNPVPGCEAPHSRRRATGAGSRRSCLP
jgi:competence ComEA-like helix-hairpin-helix protein